MKSFLILTLSLLVNSTCFSQINELKKIVLIGADFSTVSGLGFLDLYINDTLVPTNELKRVIIRPIITDSIFIKLSYINFLKKKDRLFKFSIYEKNNYFKVKFIGYPGRPQIDRILKEDLDKLKNKKWFKKESKKYHLE